MRSKSKKKWTYTFLPSGHYYHVIYTSLQDSHDLRDPRSRQSRRKNKVKSALYSNFCRCFNPRSFAVQNSAFSAVSPTPIPIFRTGKRWPPKTISRGKSASREDWGPHRKIQCVIREFSAMVSQHFFTYLNKTFIKIT